MSDVSDEQQARDMLKRMEVVDPDPDAMTCGDLEELANLIADREGLKGTVEMREETIRRLEAAAQPRPLWPSDAPDARHQHNQAKQRDRELLDLIRECGDPARGVTGFTAAQVKGLGVELIAARAYGADQAKRAESAARKCSEALTAATARNETIAKLKQQNLDLRRVLGLLPMRDPADVSPLDAFGPSAIIAVLEPILRAQALGLRVCPFCVGRGGKDPTFGRILQVPCIEELSDDGAETFGTRWRVICYGCRVIVLGDTRDEAIANWNRRPLDRLGKQP